MNKLTKNINKCKDSDVLSKMLLTIQKNNNLLLTRKSTFSYPIRSDVELLRLKWKLWKLKI